MPSLWMMGSGSVLPYSRRGLLVPGHHCSTVAASLPPVRIELALDGRLGGGGGGNREWRGAGGAA